MKVLLSFIVLAILLTSCKSDDDVIISSYPENICVGNFAITNQADLELFGSINCTQIEGSLKINGVSDLQPLDALLEVTGDLRIGGNASDMDGNPQLLSLEGIKNLKRVGGLLLIGNNDALININRLSNLISVNDLRIISNDLLQDFNNFNSLTTISNNFVFNSNASGVIELENLENIGSYFGFTSENATNINLPNLISTESFFVIMSANSLTTLNFSSLNSVGGFEMFQANSLENLDAFTGLTEINGNFRINSSDSITNLNGLSNVTSITGGLFIINNPLLSDFCGISGLSTNTDYSVLSNGYNPTQMQLNSSKECSN